jgi:glycosyltransferase involved in cell wall biosynthesis
MRKTLLYVIGDLDVGGAESHLARLLPRIDRRRFRILVYTLTHKGELAPRLIDAGIEVIGPPWGERLRNSARPPLRRFLLPGFSALGLLFLLWRRRPHVIHFFLPAAYIVGGLCSFLAPPAARVMSRRSLDHYQRGHPYLARIERFLHPRMDAVLGNSRAVVEQLRAEGVEPKRLGLLYNGIDSVALVADSPSRAATREALGITEEALVLILVANLIPYKGHTDLLAALATVGDSLPAGWRLLCVGRDDGIGEELEIRARDLGINEHIRWLGPRSDIPALLAAADIALSTSHQEGFSNSVLEGMAMGLAMIVTKVGGNPEAVEDGSSGIVVPPQDPPALAAAIRELAGDPSLRKELGAAARRRLEEHFSLSACVGAYERLYDGLTEGSPGSIAEIIGTTTIRTPGAAPPCAG